MVYPNRKLLTEKWLNGIYKLNSTIKYNKNLKLNFFSTIKI